MNGRKEIGFPLFAQGMTKPEIGSRKLITLAPPDTPLAAGDEVTIRHTDPLCLDANGDRLEGGAQ